MRNYWEKIQEFSQIPPDLLEFVVMPAYRMIATESLGLAISSSPIRKQKFFYDFDVRSKELLRGTTYKFTANIADFREGKLTIEVWELMLDA